MTPDPHTYQTTTKTTVDVRPGKTKRRACKPSVSARVPSGNWVFGAPTR
jgi:hypothetical protein